MLLTQRRHSHGQWVWAMSSAHLSWWPMGCWTSHCQSCSWTLTDRLSTILGQEGLGWVQHDTIYLKLRSLFLSFFPPAPFPCGLIKPGGLWRNSSWGWNGSAEASGSTGMLCPSWMGAQRAQLDRAGTWWCWGKGDFKGCFWTKCVHKGWRWTNGDGRRCCQLEQNTAGLCDPEATVGQCCSVGGQNIRKSCRK